MIAPHYTEAPRHLIRAGRGRVRVLRLVVDGERCYAARYVVARNYCRVCGCTERHGCLGGCAWADRQHTLCTACVETYPLLCGEDGDL